jgi:glycosyltransferase involved in cell wall biosynthesis
MKILSISNCPLQESQGSGYAILNFCRGLRARGHEVDLFGPDQIEPFPRLKRAKKYRQAAGMLLHTLRHFACRRYDIVEWYGGEACLAALALAALPGRSTLLVCHSNGLEPYCDEQMRKHLGSTAPDGAPLKWYQSDRLLPIATAFRRVDGIVTVSEFDRRYAIAQGYQPADHVAAIENALPAGFLRQAVEFARPRSFGYCGSWLLRKGSRLLEAAVPRLLVDFPDYTFTLIGVGADFRAEEHFPAPVCPRVRVVPFTEDKEELRKLYATLAVLLVPSIYESFGLVTAEGMACGCAVVATRTGFACDLQDRCEAVLLEHPAAADLYEGVKALLVNEPLRLQVARAGYDRVQRLDWPSAVTRLEDCYRSWLAEVRGKRRTARKPEAN